MGHVSTWGVTIVVEIVTGRLLDFKMTQKSTICKLWDDFEDNGNFIDGNFHGILWSMECYNEEV